MHETLYACLAATTSFIFHPPDTDECAVDNGGCEGACTNTLGSSVCSCGPGYILNGDGLTCDGTCVCKYISWDFLHTHTHTGEGGGELIRDICPSLICTEQ